MKLLIILLKEITMSKIFETKKGTKIPLMNLKGKDYMMVAYRIQWFTEEVPSFEITTTFSTLTDDQTVAHATVKVLDPDGRSIRSASGTKRETKKDFADHTEKAETAAIGRALIQLGFGTQFALSDMEEGLRLADSPLEGVKPDAKKVVDAVKQNKQVTEVAKEAVKTQPVEKNEEKVEVVKETKKVSKFAPKTKVVEQTHTQASEEVANSDDGSEWGS